MKKFEITKLDKIILCIILVIYGILSFINLGSTNNPQTFWHSTDANQYALFEIKQGRSKTEKIRYFTGADINDIYIFVSYDEENYSDPVILKEDKVFAWKESNFSGEFTYIRVYISNSNSYLGEFAIYDKSGNKLELEPLNENAKLLLDEQDTIPTDEITYMKTTYFDEIYFARTAYEHLNNMPVYEWTHPPLGKIIMSIPIAVFGMNPFAYRLLGNVAGIAMIAVIYIFAKMIFKETRYSVVAAILMAADGMHFVQTRMGTVDSYLVLFIMLAFMFMYRYVTLEDKDKLKSKLIALFFSGLFMGLAIATKWSGVFAGIALAIIFVIDFIIKLVKRKKAKEKLWNKNWTIIILSCVGFFVVIPLAIYVLSYIPYYKLGYIKDIPSFIEYQQKMYHYHADLVATHPYSSPWYTWPIMKQSVFYWAGTYESGSLSRIVLLGNPAIWWFSLPAALYFLVAGIWKRKVEYWFIFVAVVAMIMPYVGIPRIMFLYHYFPILPFVMLIIVSFIKAITGK
ncbi:MAG: phospholipid carrier-dependent glycosyltransferase, partial [Lachnospiraceae bacterium]|nr:phospholipid carrier-dependent glycosyltransferase [Lachnospiraceae bacterium]